ncbi:MAG: hypothetical protein ABFS12_01585 [Bacteroidota bacterium]
MAESILLNIEDFGTIDAESDKKLLNYFVETKYLERVLEFEKSIIIGRKGSGKTAIYKYIKKNKENTEGLLFKDYPWRIHDAFKNSIVSEQESFINSWTFLIYIEFLKLVVKNIDEYDKKTKKEIKKIKKWLKKNWGTASFDFKNTFSPRKKRFLWSFNPQAFGFSLGSISKVFENKQELSETLTEINKSLKNILTKINEKGVEYNLIFDELDLGYDPFDNTYKTRIIGLLLSAYRSYNEFGDNLRVYVFIRSDIVKELTFQDKNKIKDNIIQDLNWEPNDEDSNLSLKQLVSRRIKENITSSTDKFNSNWNSIVDNRNIGRNQKKWNYIIERTFLRPRDVIKFLNLILEEAKKRIKKEKKTSSKIVNIDIQNSKKSYSEYLYSELSDEVKAKHPNFDNYLEILREIHNVSFSLEDFTIAYEEVSKRLNIDESASEILEIFYNFSVISFYKAGGGGYGGSTYCFIYKDTDIKFNPKATKFKTHLGFKEYLDLVER